MRSLQVYRQDVLMLVQLLAVGYFYDIFRAIRILRAGTCVMSVANTINPKQQMISMC